VNGSRFAVLVAVCALTWAVPAAAAPDAPAPAAGPPAALLQKETAARAKAADEMAAFAKFCEGGADFDSARQAYAMATALNPENKVFKTNLDRMKGKKSAPSAAVVPQIAERRTKSLAKCADLLAAAAGAYAQADRSDELAQLVALMRAQGLPVDAPLAKLEIVFFQPYLDWRRKKDVEKLQAGWEVIDGVWTEPAKVAELNKKHEDWSEPWIVGDDVHEVKTNLPLRTARQVLAHVAAFRKFFLGYFAGEWDLQPPDAKLPIILTGTRADLEERTRTLDMNGAPPLAAAFYMGAVAAGNRCYVSFEIKSVTGQVTKVPFDDMLHTLQHEVGHQIAFEFSKHASDGRFAKSQFWCVEGMADFLPNYRLVNGTWVLKKRATVPMADGFVEGSFTWCRDNLKRLPPVEQFVGQSHEEFMKVNTIQNYRMAATLAWFLLEGKDRAYRPGFTKLLESVHRGDAGFDAFAVCLEGVDLKTLDTEFREFCKAVKADPK
jgi:hypothetical protein